MLNSSGCRISLQVNILYAYFSLLKGHGNEADFLGVLQKLVPHRSLTLPFEPFSFWLRLRGHIHNRKTTPRLGESGSRRLFDSTFECFKENLASRHGESRSRYSNFLKFSNDFPNFKRLNPFKRSIWQKRSQGSNVLSPLIYLKALTDHFGGGSRVVSFDHYL